MKDIEKKLRIITSKTLVPGMLSITNNKLQSNILYRTKDSNKLVNITEGSSRFRPIHCSELYYRLKSRDWNITERKYISKTSLEGKEVDLLMVKTKDTSYEIDEIDTSNTNIGIPVCNLRKPSEEEIESFKNNSNYRLILNTMDANEIYLYNSSKGLVDLLNGSVSLDIIKPSSDIYTSSVNLNDLFTVSTDNYITIKVDLSIQYSKDGKLINKDITFKGAEFENNKLVRKNLISDLNKDVRLEYINGVVKIFPLKEDIDEYIISNCTVTYGNIR